MIRHTGLVICLFSIFQIVFGGVHHNHNHKGSGGERSADGAFSPRDHDHHSDGNHDTSFDHEAILGSSKDAEEFDKLPPEEAKKRLRILVEKMDTDKDGFVDRGELHAWILRSFKSLSQEESEERFEDTDEDDDGIITWSEYRTAEFDLEDDDNYYTIGGDPDKAEELSMMEEDKILFEAADKDNNGHLTKTEFLSFTHPEEDSGMIPQVLKLTLNAKDKNKDGKISFQEYIGERGKDQSKDWLVAEKERFDSDLDKNSDGVLDEAEIIAWVIPDNEEIATDEVNHLFAGADFDVDGVLSMKEILDNHELFVGSEATDYGEHLHDPHRFDDEL